MRKDKSIMQSIQKFLRGQASPEEIKAVNDWYENQEEDELLIKDFKGRTKAVIGSDIFNGIQQARASKDPRSEKWNIKSSLGIAASILLVIGLGFVFSKLTHKDKEDFPNSITFQKVQNGIGMVKRIKLPDGSKIHLFHNTTIEFDRDFLNNRLVKLDGEAFFEVVTNPNLPFRVQTNALTTEVLGTSFAIKTGLSDQTKVAVKTGKVSIHNAQSHTFILQKDQELNYASGLGKVQQIPHPDLVFGWAEDRIVFENTGLLDMTKVLEAWYGIKIDHNLSPSNICKISGTYMDLSLENLLNAIQYSLPLTYHIDAKTVTIHFKNCD